MKKIILFSTFLLSLSAHAGFYVLGQGGYLMLRQQAAIKNSLSPTGGSFGGGIGLRAQTFELEALYLKGHATGSLTHDGVENQFIHDQSSLSLDLNFYLFPMFYIKVGYGVTKINQKLDKEISTASEQGAREKFSMQDNKSTGGAHYGAGLILYRGPSFRIYLQTDYYDFSSYDAGALNTSMGFKFNI